MMQILDWLCISVQLMNVHGPRYSLRAYAEQDSDWGKGPLVAFATGGAITK